MTDAGRAAARRNIGNEMARKGWNISDLARTAGIDVGTAGDFVNGSRWPQQSTQSKVEDALEWPRGIIRRWELELEPDALPAPPEAAAPDNGDHSGQIVLHLPAGAFDGLSVAHQEEAVALAKATLLARIREIKREVDP